jgi:ketosteroid isomerase-like protein
MAWAGTVPPNRDFTLRQIDVDGRGDLAYVYGKYSWVLMIPGQPPVPDSGKYIEVWRKQADGNWKITRDVFNSDVPLPAPPPAPTKKK